VSLGLLGADLATPPLLSNAAVFKGRFVILGRRLDLANEDERLAIWTSPDGLYWQRSAVEGISAAAHAAGVELELRDVAVGGPGLVAVGVERECCGAGVNGAIWVSVDADAWTRVYDADVDGTGGLWSIWTADDQLYAYGEPGLLTSSDGYEWEPVTIGDPPAEYLDTPIKADGFLAYAVGTGADGSAGLDLWRLDGSGWTNTGRLPDSEGASFQRGVASTSGWVILGERYRRDRVRSLAWVSADGTSWQAAPTPPAAFIATDVMADEAGFIAVGYEYPAGCAWDWSEANGETWSSSDGLVWQKSDSDGWEHKFVNVLLRSNRTLIGVGVDFDNEDGWGNGAVWTAKLPPLAPAEPRTPPDGLQVGCG